MGAAEKDGRLRHYGLVIAIGSLLSLGACGGKDRVESMPAPEKVPAPPQPKAKFKSNDWHVYVSMFDRDRLQRWRSAWITGLDKATKAGNAPQIAAQGLLLKPDQSLDKPELPAGNYRCRTIKMGAQAKGMLDYIAYPYFTCRVTEMEGRLRLTKLDGSQRPVGDIFPDEGNRMIFLGSMMLGDETRPLPYGRDSERDMVGIVERVGAQRWRIAFPYPRWESQVDVMELLPKDQG